MTALDETRRFWDRAACGEELYLTEPDANGFREQARIRYALEPEIVTFANFSAARGKRVLEIGVGLGADHQRFAEAGAVLTGIDLTDRAIAMTRRRFEIFGLTSELQPGNAEQLAFPDNSFDIVYSWGVIHHSPSTARAVDEIYRVLKPGGSAWIMIYHKYSLVGFMLWIRYALFAGRPFTSLRTIYARWLESPGTKAYSKTEARELFRKFKDVSIDVHLGHADLLASRAGQRHGGALLGVARRIWPRWFFRRFCRGNGLTMMIRASKPK
jgi:ubiquinone/menaquinone biosynthesis C-methylase UbiE